MHRYEHEHKSPPGLPRLPATSQFVHACRPSAIGEPALVYYGVI